LSCIAISRFPPKNQLPASLLPLRAINGPVIADERHFEFDIKQLMNHIERHIVKTRPAVGEVSDRRGGDA
jgi:hypothetical protein